MIQTPLHKKLFYLLVFLLPVNLGKHFIVNSAYVGGLLIDYLLPTIYFLDILVLIILLLWIIDLIRFKSKIIFSANSKLLQLLIFFVFCVLLSVISAIRFVPAITAFARLFLYFLFSLYVLNTFDVKKDFSDLATIFLISVGLLSVMALLQWIRQGAIFNNYLLFGEQPYTSATAGIATKSFFGIGKVPPYATFRHPNAFAGFLSVLLIWVSFKKTFLAKSVLVLGLIALFFTLSKTAWVALILGFFFKYILERYGRKGFYLSIFITSAAIVCGMLLIFLPDKNLLSYNPSLFRRVNFIVSATQSIKQNPLFGVGYNNDTAIIEKYLPPVRDIRFVQPVHNIFLLIGAESGLLALGFFLVFLILLSFKIYATSHNNSVLLLISIFQILILGSFDHYFWTMQQTLLLFWLLVGISLAVTSRHN